MTKDKEIQQVVSIAKAIGATLLLIFGRRQVGDASQPYQPDLAANAIDHIAQHYKLDDLEN